MHTGPVSRFFGSTNGEPPSKMITPIMLPKIGFQVINKAALKFIERYQVFGTKVKMALAYSGNVFSFCIFLRKLISVPATGIISLVGSAKKKRMILGCIDIGKAYLAAEGTVIINWKIVVYGDISSWSAV